MKKTFIIEVNDPNTISLLKNLEKSKLINIKRSYQIDKDYKEMIEKRKSNPVEMSMDEIVNECKIVRQKNY
ncbi:MAG: hypothetical protein SNJ77_12045, partial [Cytophagales bacterium]